MQSFCSRFVFSCEGARYSFFAQLEQLFALCLRAFESALHDCATLLALLVSKVQFTQKVTHARAASPAHSLVTAHFFIAVHSLPASLHPFDSVAAKCRVGRCGRRLCLLRERYHATCQYDS